MVCVRFQTICTLCMHAFRIMQRLFYRLHRLTNHTQHIHTLVATLGYVKQAVTVHPEYTVDIEYHHQDRNYQTTCTTQSRSDKMSRLVLTDLKSLTQSVWGCTDTSDPGHFGPKTLQASSHARRLQSHAFIPPYSLLVYVSTQNNVNTTLNYLQMTAKACHLK